MSIGPQHKKMLTPMKYSKGTWNTVGWEATVELQSRCSEGSWGGTTGLRILPRECWQVIKVKPRTTESTYKDIAIGNLPRVTFCLSVVHYCTVGIPLCITVCTVNAALHCALKCALQFSVCNIQCINKASSFQPPSKHVHQIAAK